VNHLAGSLSPYLLAHADDPVDWYPWGDEAVRVARETDRPVLLSIGYSACHWCHVMQHESFRDPAIAQLINRDFVAVKVDREELPDVDQVYQRVLGAVAGQGGWPLTAFLTPGLQPFHIGTYFPPERRYGREGFAQVLAAVADAYRERRGEVEAVARSWAEAAREEVPAPGAVRSGGSADAALEGAAAAVLRLYDARHGGFGGAPKFPQAPLLHLLLRAAQRPGGAEAHGALSASLRAMRRGGLHDQLGGGFHRYAVDGRWQVPHFEKMLDDQTDLSRLYLGLWLLGGDDWALATVRSTLAYVDRCLSDPDGGFWTAQDADSPAGEGGYYRFPADEVAEICGADAPAAVLRYGLDDPRLAREGVLQDARGPAEVARALGSSEEEVRAALGRAAAALSARRDARTPPAADEKVLAGPTGRAISAFARAGAAVGEEAWLARAARAATFAKGHLIGPGGDVLRRYRGGQAGIPGYLEDYAGLGQGFLDLFLAQGGADWLDLALALARRALDLFCEPGRGCLASAASPTPLGRPVDRFDGARAAAQSSMLRLLLLLAPFDADLPAGEVAEAVSERHAALWAAHPEAVPSLVEARDLLLRGPWELTVAADPGDAEAQAWLEQARRLPWPDVLPTLSDPTRPAPVWRGRTAMAGRPTLYACRLGRCSLPLHDFAPALAFFGDER